LRNAIRGLAQRVSRLEAALEARGSGKARHVATAPEVPKARRPASGPTGETLHRRAKIRIRTS
jgi:hypothetical protein